MPPQTLRPYQEDGVKRVLQAYKDGARSVLMVLPTGGGKTTIFGTLGADLVRSNKHVVTVVHRRELATQAANRFREFGTDFGFILSGQPTKPYARLQIASVQTLIRRQPPPADLVICDEAHLSTAKSWQTVLSAYPHARILGCTATPFRLSGKPLAAAYDRLVVIATPRELREAGWLCPYVGFSYLAPDLSDVKTTGGDYNEKQSAEAMGRSVIVDSVIDQWGKHARDLSTVVFNVTVEHSKAVTERFKAAGVAAEHIDGGTPLETRRAILKRVESGQTRVLCNVGIAVEGLDIPRLKCCVLNRPTKSVSRALQMVGRVRRPWQGVTARIHDHAFVLGEKGHGLPDDDRDYSLSAKLAAPPSLRTCDVCLAIFSGNVCPACAHENAPREQDREIQTIADAEQVTFSSEETPRNPKPVEIHWGEPGRIVEGVYQRAWGEATRYGAQRRYLLAGERRDYVLPGTAELDKLMSRAETGWQLRVTHTANDPFGTFGIKRRFKVERDA